MLALPALRSSLWWYRSTNDLVPEHHVEACSALDCAVVTAVESVTAEFVRHEIDRATVEGYRRVPPGDDELRAERALVCNSILEEPW